MTPEQKQAVIDKVRELVPELQELSFGCRVKVERPHPNVEIVSEEGLGGGDIYTNKFGIRKWGEFEIIGHPIHLRHVLMAMEQIDFRSHNSMAVYAGFVPNAHKLMSRWNLPDPLANQSDEVWEFLGYVLNIYEE